VLEWEACACRHCVVGGAASLTWNDGNEHVRTTTRDTIQTIIMPTIIMETMIRWCLESNWLLLLSWWVSHVLYCKYTCLIYWMFEPPYAYYLRVCHWIYLLYSR
jgi:hypothetical protein